MSDQVDLFLDSIVDAPVKDDQALMAYPFFSLEKKPRIQPIIYDDGKVRVEVRPGEKGIATIWDKDILIYLVSVINDALERGATPGRTIRFHAYDLMRTTGRDTGGGDYEALFDSLFRLRSTTIITSIESDKTKERTGFGWIDNFRIVTRDIRNGSKVMGSVEVTLNDWMYRAIVKDRRILTINREYFKLSKGLERRLYELARKHCGRQPRWTISLEKLAQKCGVRMDLRRFKFELRKIIAADRIPEYQLGMSFDGKSKPAIVSELVKDDWRWGSNKRIIVVIFPRPGALARHSVSGYQEQDSGDREQKLG